MFPAIMHDVCHKCLGVYSFVINFVVGVVAGVISWPRALRFASRSLTCTSLGYASNAVCGEGGCIPFPNGLVKPLLVGLPKDHFLDLRDE